MLKEVGKLDSALCNQEFRPVFENHLNGSNTILNNDTHCFISISLVSWLAVRNVNVNKLSLKDRNSILNSKQLKSTVGHIFQGLTHLKIACGSIFMLFESIVGQSPDLHSLELVKAGTSQQTASFNETIPILRNCPNVRILTLQQLHDVNSTFSKFNCFPNMTELRTTRCDDVTIETINCLMAKCPGLIRLNLNINCRSHNYLQWLVCIGSKAKQLKFASVTIADTTNERNHKFTLNGHEHHSELTTNFVDAVEICGSVPDIYHLTVHHDKFPPFTTKYIFQNYYYTAPTTNNYLSSLTLKEVRTGFTSGGYTITNESLMDLIICCVKLQRLEIIDCDLPHYNARKSKHTGLKLVRIVARSTGKAIDWLYILQTAEFQPIKFVIVALNVIDHDALPVSDNVEFEERDE